MYVFGKSEEMDYLIWKRCSLDWTCKFKKFAFMQIQTPFCHSCHALMLHLHEHRNMSWISAQLSPTFAYSKAPYILVIYIQWEDIFFRIYKVETFFWIWKRGKGPLRKKLLKHFQPLSKQFLSFFEFFSSLHFFS